MLYFGRGEVVVFNWVRVGIVIFEIGNVFVVYE